MLGNIILTSSIMFLIWARIKLNHKLYYKRIVFITYILTNIFTIMWYILQYYYLYQDYFMTDPDMSIRIVPRLFLELSSVFVLNIIHNLLYVILIARKSFN